MLVIIFRSVFSVSKYLAHASICEIILLFESGNKNVKALKAFGSFWGQDQNVFHGKFPLFSLKT